jgi:hypothetical protein
VLQGIKIAGLQCRTMPKEFLSLKFFCGPQIKLDISLGNDLSMMPITSPDVSTHLWPG